MNVKFVTGNVGRDPEIQFTTNGSKVAKFSIAARAGFGKDAPTEWNECVVWGKLADVVEQYVAKGSKIAVVGRVEFDQWTDKNTGEARTRAKLNVQELELLGSRQDADHQQQQSQEPAKPAGMPF